MVSSVLNSAHMEDFIYQTTSQHRVTFINFSLPMEHTRGTNLLPLFKVSTYVSTVVQNTNRLLTSLKNDHSPENKNEHTD